MSEQLEQPAVRGTRKKAAPEPLTPQELRDGATRFLDAVDEALRDSGLAIRASELELDGQLHRCGVEGKERGTDGAYILHVDPIDLPYTFWCINWQTGAEQNLSDRPRKEMSRAERARLKERIEAARRKANEDLSRRRREAAGKAVELLGKCKLLPPDGQHPYLTRKGVHPCPGLRTLDNSLVVPVQNSCGGVLSLQFIDASGTKRFLKDGMIAGGRFAIPGKEDGPLLICEGLATGLSLSEATGYAVFAAFSCGNLQAVAAEARREYPTRLIVVCADNDAKTEAQGRGNPGRDKAQSVAANCGCLVALCPLIEEGRSVDFNDLHNSRGLEEVRRVIDATLAGEQPVRLPEPYFYDAQGRLCKMEPTDSGDAVMQVICEHVEVLGRTAGEAQWGYLLRFKDRRKRLKTLAVPARLFQTTRTDLSELLADEGLEILPKQYHRFKSFCLAFGDELPVVDNVTRVGWTESGDFVLPEGAISPSGHKVVFQGARDQAGPLYAQCGTLAEWQKTASLAAGNPLLTFSLAVAFAAPLLKFARIDGGTFHLHGESSAGKTTTLNLAASVWGNPEGQKRTWRATDNGLEAACSQFSDTLLCLDELGQIRPDALDSLTYMLASGLGKSRARRDGSFRQPYSWRLLALSSGELTIAAKLAEGGIHQRAGQQVRFLDIPVGGADVHVLHDRPSAQALVDEIDQRAKTFFGVAGHEYLQRLVRELPKVRDNLPAQIERARAAIFPAGEGGQTGRVARLFALVCAGGEQAQAFGILPKELDVPGAVKECFTRWLANRGGLGPVEDKQILAQVRYFLELHGNSRFEDPANEYAKVVNRVGYRRRQAMGPDEFLVFPEAFKAELCKGFDVTRCCQVLKDAGWLQIDSTSRYQVRKQIQGSRQRFYCIVLPEDPAEPLDNNVQTQPQPQAQAQAQQCPNTTAQPPTSATTLPLYGPERQTTEDRAQPRQQATSGSAIEYGDDPHSGEVDFQQAFARLDGLGNSLDRY